MYVTNCLRSKVEQRKKFKDTLNGGQYRKFHIEKIIKEYYTKQSIKKRLVVPDLRFAINVEFAQYHDSCLCRCNIGKIIFIHKKSVGIGIKHNCLITTQEEI